MKMGGVESTDLKKTDKEGLLNILSNFFLKLLTLCFVLIPSIGVTDIGFRDLKIGSPKSVFEQHCERDIGFKYKCYDIHNLQFKIYFDDIDKIRNVWIIFRDKLSKDFYTNKQSLFWELHNNFSQKYKWNDCIDLETKVDNFLNKRPLKNGLIWLETYYRVNLESPNSIHLTVNTNDDDELTLMVRYSYQGSPQSVEGLMKYDCDNNSINFKVNDF